MLKLKNSFQWFVIGLKTVISILKDIVLILFGIVMVLSFLKVLQPLSQAITLLVVIYFTAITFTSWKRAMLSLTGILLYIASWPIAEHYGIWASAPTIILGFSLWVFAIYKTAILCVEIANNSY